MKTKVFIFLFLSYSFSFAQNGSSASFLRIGLDARASSIGGAFAGVLNDPGSIYYNPAGLARLKYFEVNASYNTWIMDMNFQYLSVIIPLFGQAILTQGEAEDINSKYYHIPYGCISASIFFFSSGKMESIDEDLNVTGEYSAYDIAGTVAYANKFGDEFAYGIAAKIFQQRIENFSSIGFGADLGIQYIPDLLKDFVLGLSLQNLGPGLKFNDESEPLPINFKFGGAYSIGSLLIASDVNIPKDKSVRFNFGAEYNLVQNISLRAGYNTAGSFTTGLGLSVSDYLIDYAFIPIKDFGVGHRITAKIRF